MSTHVIPSVRVAGETGDRILRYTLGERFNHWIADSLGLFGLISAAPCSRIVRTVSHTRLLALATSLVQSKLLIVFRLAAANTGIRSSTSPMRT